MFSKRLIAKGHTIRDTFVSSQSYQVILSAPNGKRWANDDFVHSDESVRLGKCIG